MAGNATASGRLIRAAADVRADDRAWIDDPRLDPVRSAARDARAVVVVGAAVRYPTGRRG